MAHQVIVKELINGIEITENLDGVIVVKLLSYNSRPFLRTTNETDEENYQILDRIGEIYHLPALATEFTLIDINNNYFIPANGEELIEYSYKIRIFRPENEFDKVLNVGTVEATSNTVKVNIPSVGLPNSVLINGSIYENYYPSLFNFVAVVEFTKILIVYAKPDSTVFYLAQGVEALSAVEPDYDGLFVARIIVDINGYVVEYPNYGVITEDSDTVTFTGNGTAGNPLSAESVGGETLYNDFTETLAGDILKRVDINTGENVNYRETTTWQDGSTMDDSKVDNIIYIKKEGKYYKRQFEGVVNVKWFGAVGDGVVDDTQPILKASEYANAGGFPLYIPAGNYHITGEVIFYTDVICEGTIKAAKKTSDVIIKIKRNNVATMVNITDLSRGANVIPGIYNGDVIIDSSEVLIERFANAPYLKTEALRVVNGRLLSPVVNSYSVATASVYPTEKPIEIKGLKVEVYGTKNDDRYIDCERSDVTFNNLQIINKTETPAICGITLRNCINVSLYDAIIKGFDFEGAGYGVAVYSSSTVTLNNCEVTKCRHGYTGRNTTDIKILNGVFSEGIDDHWTDRFMVDGVTINTGVGLASLQFAGNDIDVRNIKCYGSARVFFAIRTDTPHLGGTVNISNIFWNTDIDDAYCFAYSSPNGSQDLPSFSETPKMPNNITIKDVEVQTSGTVVYLVYVGTFNEIIKNPNFIKISGLTSVKGSNLVSTVGVLWTKNEAKQTGVLNIEFNGASVKASGEIKSVYLSSIDTTFTSRANVLITACDGWNVSRFSAYSVEKYFVKSSTFSSWLNDNSGADMGEVEFVLTGCEMKGGEVHQYLVGALFNSCVFTSTYSNFPPQGQNSFLNCIRKNNVSGLPANITNSINTPYI